jgi:hypothetical protein
MKCNGTHMVDSNFFISKQWKIRWLSFEKWNHPAMVASPYAALQLLSLSYNLTRDTEAKDGDLVFLFYNRGFRTSNIRHINKSPLVCCRCNHHSYVSETFTIINSWRGWDSSCIPHPNIYSVDANRWKPRWVEPIFSIIRPLLWERKMVVYPICPRTSFHARSNSLPSRPHLIISEFERDCYLSERFTGHLYIIFIIKRPQTK